MIYSIFSLYQLDTKEYKIKEIILSNGENIELENNFIQNEENEENVENEILTKENIGKAVLGTGVILEKKEFKLWQKKKQQK